MSDRSDTFDRTFAILDRARAAGMTLRNERAGLIVRPAAKLDPDLARLLSVACADVRAALRAELAAGRAIRRAARRPLPFNTQHSPLKEPS